MIYFHSTADGNEPMLKKLVSSVYPEDIKSNFYIRFVLRERAEKYWVYVSKSDRNEDMAYISSALKKNRTAKS